MKKSIKYSWIIACLGFLFCSFTASGFDINKNLVAYYPFDGDVLDYSGNENNGIILTYLEYERGIKNLAALFKLQPEYSSLITVKNSPSLSFSSQGFTVSFWYKPEMKNYITNEEITVPISRGDIFSGFELYSNLFADSSISVGVKHSEPNQIDIKTGICNYLWGTDKWIHIAYTLKNDTIKIFANGILINEEITASDIVNRTGDFYFGGIAKLITEQIYKRAFIGSIDELRIYSTSLTNDDVFLLYLQDKELSLLDPNGSEKYYNDELIDLSWISKSPTKPVIIEYSLNSGNTWNLITNNAFGGHYQWKPPSETNSQKCLIRMRQENEIINEEVKILGLGMLRGAIYSPDGQKIATYGYEGVFIWDADYKRVITKIYNNSYSAIMSIAFSPDGTEVAAVFQDKRIVVWDILNGQELRSTDSQAHKAQINSIRYNKEGDRLITASDDKTVIIWDAYNLRPIETIGGHSESVLTAVFSDDGKYLATGGKDRIVIIRERSSGFYVFTSFTFVNDIIALKFKPNSDTLAVAVKDSVFIFDIKKQVILKTFPAFANQDYSIDFSDSGIFLSIVSENDNQPKLVKLINAVNFTLEGLYIAPEGIRTVDISQDDKHLLLGGMLNSVIILEIPSLNKPAFLDGHYGQVSRLRYTKDNRSIVTVSGKFGDPRLKIWDAASGLERKSYIKENCFLYTFAFNSDNSMIATGSGTGQITLMNMNDGSEIWTVKAHNLWINDIEISPDNSLIASASADSSIKVWNFNTGELLHTFKITNSAVNSVCFHKFENKIAVGSEGKQLFEIDLNTEEIINEFTYFDPVTKVRYSNSGKILLASSYCYIMLNYLDYKDSVRVIRDSYSNTITTFDVSYDDNYIISGGINKKLVLWNMNDLSFLKEYQGHKNIIYTVEFSPDGTKIASGSSDGGIRIWNFVNENSSNFDESDCFFSILSPKSNEKLKIIKPKAGDLLHISEDFNIVWESNNINMPHTIYFSIDGGKNWELIADSVSGGEYLWDNIPDMPTKKLLVKIEKGTLYQRQQLLNKVFAEYEFDNNLSDSKSNLGDFETSVINYAPDRYLLENNSVKFENNYLKTYMGKFRNPAFTFWYYSNDFVNENPCLLNYGCSVISLNLSNDTNALHKLNLTQNNNCNIDTPQSLASVQGINKSQWNFIVIQTDAVNEKLELWINNRFRGSTEYYSDLGGDTLRLGANYNENTSSILLNTYLSGKIDELKVFTNPIKINDIDLLYNTDISEPFARIRDFFINNKSDFLQGPSN